MGRATQGVRLINLEKRNDQIAAVCKVNSTDDIIEDENISVESVDVQNESGTEE